MKTKKQAGKSVWPYVGLALVVLAVAGYFLSAPVRRQHRTQHDVDVLLLAINGFVREQGDVPTGDCATICRLLRGESIDGQNPKHLDYVEAEAYEINPKGEFVDPWGTPYRIALENTPRVYSCGPNKTDEKGSGDDIIGH